MRTVLEVRPARLVTLAMAVAVAVAGGSTESLRAQAGARGQWRTLTNQAPINPVHVALMHTGDVLIVAGSGNVATETHYQAAVVGPAVADVPDEDRSPGTCSATGWSSCTTAACSSTGAISSTTRFMVSGETRCTTRRPTRSPTSRTWRMAGGIPQSPPSATVA